MTSTIKVNNIQNQCGANIINENSNTITLGASGDTISLAAGASQTGFGRTGTVDWITTPKTSDFTAVSGEGYFINSAGGAVIVTLPSSPAANSIVSISDYNGSIEINPITVARNGSNINGDASNYVITNRDSAVTFVFVDATAGWTSVNTANVSDNFSDYIIANVSGSCNTLTTSGDYKIATFKGPGTFTVTNAGTATGSNKVDYLVVAGGGSGGGGNNAGAGGGGGGGLRVSPGTETGCWTASPLGAAPAVALPVTVTGYPITVGGGGSPVVAGCGNGPAGNNGNNSIFSTITSAGGGGGGGHCAVAKSGGSGGGGSGAGTTVPGPGGSGNTPPVSPPQGNDGGSGGSPASTNYPSGGGGGAGGVGTSRPANNLPGGPGGAGVQVNIDGNNYYWSGGGAGPAWTGGGDGGNGGIGGGGGGGAGQTGPGTPGSGGGSAINSGGGNSPVGTQGGAGGANSGGGGGGGNGAPGNSGAGGSGIVIIRYKFQN